VEDIKKYMNKTANNDAGNGQNTQLTYRVHCLLP